MLKMVLEGIEWPNWLVTFEGDEGGGTFEWILSWLYFWKELVVL